MSVDQNVLNVKKVLVEMSILNNTKHGCLLLAFFSTGLPTERLADIIVDMILFLSLFVFLLLEKDQVHPENLRTFLLSGM